MTTHQTPDEREAEYDADVAAALKFADTWLRFTGVTIPTLSITDDGADEQNETIDGSEF